MERPPVLRAHHSIADILSDERQAPMPRSVRHSSSGVALTPMRGTKVFTQNSVDIHRQDRCNAGSTLCFIIALAEQAPETYWPCTPRGGRGDLCHYQISQQSPLNGRELPNIIDELLRMSQNSFGGGHLSAALSRNPSTRTTTLCTRPVCQAAYGDIIAPSKRRSPVPL